LSEPCKYEGFATKLAQIATAESLLSASDNLNVKLWNYSLPFGAVICAVGRLWPPHRVPRRHRRPSTDGNFNHTAPASPTLASDGAFKSNRTASATSAPPVFE
jgi:hypothetical protein